MISEEIISNLVGMEESDRDDAIRGLVREHRRKLKESGVEDVRSKVKTFRAELDQALSKEIDQSERLVKGIKQYLRAKGVKVKRNKSPFGIDRLPVEKLARRTTSVVADRPGEVILYIEALGQEHREPLPKLQILFHNLSIIQSELEEYELDQSTRAFTTETFEVDSILGAIPLGPLANRDAIYDFWAEVSTKYAAVEDALEQAIEAGADGLKSYKGKDLRYVTEFNPIEIEDAEPIGRLYNYMGNLAVLEKVAEEGEIHSALTEDKEEAAHEKRARRDTNRLLDMMEEMSDDFGDSILDPTLTESSEDDATVEFLNELTTVDPLLAIHFASSKILALTEQGLNEMQSVMKSIISTLNVGGTVKLELEDKITADMQALEDTITADKGEYYLPYTVYEAMTGGLTPDVSVEVVDKLDLTDVVDFFADVAEVLQEFPHTFPSRAMHSLTTLPESGKVAERARSSARTPATRGEPKELSEDLRKSFKVLLDAMDAYYFSPLYSGRAVVEMPDFLNSYGAKVIMTEGPRLGINMLESTAYDELLELETPVEKQDLHAIYTYLNNIVGYGGVEVGKQLIRDGEKAAEALTNIFGNKDANNNHMAGILNFVVEETGADIGDREFNGRSIAERAESYAKAYSAGKAFPLFALPLYLERNRGIIERDSQMKREAGKLRDLFRNLKALPMVLSKMLKAHDAIREIKGQDTQYGFRPLDIDNIEWVINKMANEHSVDLAHIEVENIVYEVDAFANIAKSYGVSEEVVYQVKAQFR